MIPDLIWQKIYLLCICQSVGRSENTSDAIARRSDGDVGGVIGGSASPLVCGSCGTSREVEVPKRSCDDLPKSLSKVCVPLLGIGGLPTGIFSKIGGAVAVTAVPRSG